MSPLIPPCGSVRFLSQIGAPKSTLFRIRTREVLLLKSGTFQRFLRDVLVTVTVVAVASGLRVLLAPVLYDRAAFQLFTLAVMISAWKGGWRIGAIATVIASIVGVWLFVAPFYVANVHDIQDAVQTTLFATTGFGISLLAGKLHKSRLAAEQEARNARRVRDELSELLESITEGFEALDREFRITYANGAAEQIVGRPAVDLIGKPVWNEFPANLGTRIERQLCQVMLERTPVSSEQFCEHWQRWFAIDVYPFRDGISVLFRDISDRKRSESERERLIGELQDALAKVRTLRGLIPICASCKKIRDDKGYWEQIEVYIRDHSEANFSHGMCPDCAEKYWEILDHTS